MNTIITGLEAKLTPYSNSVKKKANLRLGSRFFNRISRRYEKERSVFEFNHFGLFEHEKVLEVLQKTYPIETCLRILRQLVQQELLKLDCESDLSLEEVMSRISKLAEFSLLKASESINGQLWHSYGIPTNDDGSLCQIAIISMGKLGAKELNVSSDVDLVYVYEMEGQTQIDPKKSGQKSISNQEYYLKWSMAMQKMISVITEHGFVFRIDLDLRPYGKDSASVLSLNALEEYFQKNARPWERFAWLKARVLGAEQFIFKNKFSEKAYAVIDSFVYRQYADFQLKDSLREIHSKIQKQASVSSNLKDIKLGRGGIREIEFGVQLFQVMYAGTRPELRTRSTFEALKYLSTYKLMTNHQCEQWEVSYRFLRTLEHRIQYLDDQQTHKLPEQDSDLTWVADTMGYEDLQQLNKTLVNVCNYVQDEFDQLLNSASVVKEVVHSSFEKEANNVIINMGHQLVEQIEISSQITMEATRDLELKMDAIKNIRNLCEKWSKQLIITNEQEQGNRTDTQAINELKRNKNLWLCELIERNIAWLKRSEVTYIEINHWFDWIDVIFKRENYLSLQMQHPKVQLDISHLMGASSWCRRYLKYYPSVIEQLVNDDGKPIRLKSEDFIELMNKRRDVININTEKEDEEQLLRMLRREHHACLFKILVADLNGKLSIEEISDDLSELAEGVLNVCVGWIWSRMSHQDTLLSKSQNPPLAIIGYGKLGSKELGYGSDLDLVLLYDETDHESMEKIPILARRLISWMTLKTSDGDLYEIDNALRPNGSAGLLVSSFDAFEKYQRQLDQNSAWTWEHQALTRARFYVGKNSLKERFEAIRQEVLSLKRSNVNLLVDVFEMRKKLWLSHKAKIGFFNGKFSPGGMIDVEFVVQYLILAHANSHIELTQNIGNIGLLKVAENKGLIPLGLGDQAGDAYRVLRKNQHATSLQEKSFEINDGSLKDEEKTIKKLWLCFFDAYW